MEAGMKRVKAEKEARRGSESSRQSGGEGGGENKSRNAQTGVALHLCLAEIHSGGAF